MIRLKSVLGLLLAAGVLTACEESESKTLKPIEMKAETEKKEIVLYPEIEDFINSLSDELDTLGDERTELLTELAEFISSELDSNRTAKLTFICTHNSRRSHMSQIWAAVMAARFGVEQIDTFSGGTEATAFNPRAVASMKRTGFRIHSEGSENPRYSVAFSADVDPLICFSKKYDDSSNPSEGFAAIMTCSDADESCPFIPGASFRIPIPYDDPKAADGTPEESIRYDERSRQIAAEMYFLFQKVSNG